MVKVFGITAMACLLAAAPAMAQQSSQDSTARQVHDQGKDDLNSIGTAEDQALSNQGSLTPNLDTNQVHEDVHGAVQKSSDLFDGVTSQFR